MCIQPLTSPPNPSHVPARASAIYRGLFAIDIIGYGRRPATVHPYLRTTLYQLVTASFSAIGIGLEHCHHEDRGDGSLVILPANASPEPVLGPLASHLQTGLRQHNQLSSPAAQLRLRASANAATYEPTRPRRLRHRHQRALPPPGTPTPTRPSCPSKTPTSHSSPPTGSTTIWSTTTQA